MVLSVVKYHIYCFNELSFSTPLKFLTFWPISQPFLTLSANSLPFQCLKKMKSDSWHFPYQWEPWFKFLIYNWMKTYHIKNIIVPRRLHMQIFYLKTIEYFNKIKLFPHLPTLIFFRGGIKPLIYWLSLLLKKEFFFHINFNQHILHCIFFPFVPIQFQCSFFFMIKGLSPIFIESSSFSLHSP